MATALIGYLGNVLTSSKTVDGNYYDWYYTWYRFNEEITHLIDEMFTESKNCKLTTVERVGRGRVIPGEGYHYFKWSPDSWLHYITFEKKYHQLHENITIWHMYHPFRVKHLIMQ